MIYQVIKTNNLNQCYNKKIIQIVKYSPNPIIKFIKNDNMDFEDSFLIFDESINNKIILELVKEYFIDTIKNIIINDHNDCLYDELNHILNTLHNDFEITNIKYDCLIIYDIKNKKIIN